MSWPLFDRIRAYLRSSGVYQQERAYQDQSSIDRILAGGQFYDFSQQQALLDQTNLQINRLERYKDYDLMGEIGEVCLALDLMADEASLFDPERKHTLVIKSKYSLVKDELEELFFQQLLIDNRLRPMARYLCKYGDFPAEVIPTKNRNGVASLKFMNVYNFTRIETKFGDLVGFFYQDELMQEPTFLHPWQVMHLRLTSFENLSHPYGQCQKWSTPIWTPAGWKRMQDLKPGDTVYSFDGQRVVPTKVVKTILNGVKKTIKINTKHRSITVTLEHPVLAVVKNNYINSKIGITRDITTQQYIKAADLKLGDKLILPKLHNIGRPIVIDQYRIVGHAGRRMSFPKHVTTDIAKLMGFLVGDGWISKNGRSLCFAEGERPLINAKYKAIIRNLGFTDDPYRQPPHANKSEYSSVQYRSIELAQTITRLGLKGKAWEKRVPDWVYEATDDIKLAFIEGLVDSDGSLNIDKWNCLRYQLEVTSKDLVDGTKVLLDQLNIKCGNVSSRSCPITGKSYGKTHRLAYSIYWYDSKMSSGYLKHSGHRRTKYNHSTDDMLVETIVSIEDGGEVEVGDIQVESEYHNFIGDGVVVHNSTLEGGRKASKQLRLMEDAALIHRISRAPLKRVFKIPVGSIPAKEVPEYMMMIARQFKNTRFYDARTGTFNERYAPLIQEDDFWLPVRPDGTGPDVTNLEGSETLDQIKDIEYFKKRMIAPMKIPFARVGLGEGAGQANGKALSSEDASFAKAIQFIQREIAMGLTKVALCHLSMAGFTIEQMKSFTISLSATSAIDELYRIETWNGRAGVMSDLKDLGWFPSEWIITRFTDLSPDEIIKLEEFKAESGEDEEGAGGPGGGGGGMGGMGGLGGLGGLGGEPGGEPGVGGPGGAVGGAGGGGEVPGATPAGGAAPEGEEAPGEGEAKPNEAEMVGDLFGGMGESANQLAKRVILEDKKQQRRDRLYQLISKVRETENNLTNGLNHLVECNELVGLQKQDGNLIMESSIDPSLAEEAKAEYYKVLTGKIDEDGELLIE